MFFERLGFPALVGPGPGIDYGERFRSAGRRLLRGAGVRVAPPARRFIVERPPGALMDRGSTEIRPLPAASV